MELLAAISTAIAAGLASLLWMQRRRVRAAELAAEQAETWRDLYKHERNEWIRKHDAQRELAMRAQNEAIKYAKKLQARTVN